MPFEEYQRQVDEWTSQFTPQYWEPHRILGQMQEELGEVAKIINSTYGDRSPKQEEHVKDLSDELGDLLFAVVCMANREGIDLSEAWQQSFDKKTKRDSKRFKKKD